MIVHFFEVWIALLVAFGLGCALGALVYEFAGQSALASSQRVASRRVGDLLGWGRARLGMDAGWREYRYLPEQVTPFGEQPFEQKPPAPALPPPDDSTAAEGVPQPEDKPGLPAVVDPFDDGGPKAAFLSEQMVPEPESEPAPAPDIDAKRPAGLDAPRRGVPDNLQRIRGVGRKNEALLNKLGIFHFGQIAAWTPAEAVWISQQMAFPERIERDDWIGQAVLLASGADTGVTKAADRRRARRDELFHEDELDDDGFAEGGDTDEDEFAEDDFTEEDFTEEDLPDEEENS